LIARSENLRQYIVHLLHISYIKNVTRLCQSILQSRCRSIEMGALRARWYLSYTACVFILHRPEIFRIYFEWIFYRALAEKLAAQTKFEVKRHFTIRAGHIADTR